MRAAVLNHTKPGALVYDPFLGSGTTLAAAELTQRVCYGLELDPKYADVIGARLAEPHGRISHAGPTAQLSSGSSP